MEQIFKSIIVDIPTKVSETDNDAAINDFEL